MRGDILKIKGQIENIIYSNESNGYTVCEMISENQLVTAVGYLPFLNVGDVIIATGDMIQHNVYGEQLKVNSFEKVMPSSLEEIEKYLGSGIIKGVGPVTARKIVERFGDDSIYVLKCEPYKLSEIKGINNEKAQIISEEFNKLWELWQLVTFLQKYDIGTANATRVYNKFGENAIDKIKDNPYILLDVLYGVGFEKVDKIANALGVDYDSPYRIASAIKHGLKLASRNGHTCVSEKPLIDFVINTLGVPEELVTNEMTALTYAKEIYIENEMVFLKDYYESEENVARKLVSMSLDKVKKSINLDKKIEEQEQKIGIELSNEQREAIKMVFKSRVSIITGGPGTGKTTIIKMLVNLFNYDKMSIALCAPTGRAAKRITETTGEDAKTLHRFLEIGKLDDDGIDINYSVSKIEKDVVIVDEVSMVDIVLMNYLTKALKDSTRLVLIGDSDQLPSVGAGVVLKDLINSEIIPTMKLTEIYRQAKESKIVVNAHKINNGEKLDLTDKSGDFLFARETNILEQIKELIANRLPKLRKI